MFRNTPILHFLTVFSLLALILVPLQPATAEELHVRITQVDNSGFPQVTVYVSVTDENGEPVGVSPSSLQLFEDGELMQPDQISGEGEVGRITTLLIMDLSGSMRRGGKLDAARNAAKAYIAQLRPGDQAGLIAFNVETMTLQPITSDRASLDSAVDRLTAEDDTAMYDALLEGIKSLENVSGRKAIILLSDGYDNRSTNQLQDVLAAVESGSLSISTIGLGDPANEWTLYGLDEEALQTLAESAGGLYGTASDSQSLQALYESYGRALQSEYRIMYTSPSTLRDGINRTLTITLADAGNVTSAETRYNPGGVLPEVSERSWTIFGAGLIVLITMAVIPGAIGSITASAKRKRRPHIRLK